MRLGLRLFFGFFVICGLTAFFLLRVFMAEVKPSVREVMEDIMVDTANLLAELARDDLAALAPGADLRDSRFAARVKDYAERPIDAQIWGLRKQTLDFRIYVTDTKGRVLLDSGPGTNGSAVGADYSKWRDVRLTLRGEYGARSTRIVETDDASAVMYVAAPVRRDGAVIGVVTVAKPIATVQRFVDRAERRILVAGALLLALSLAVGVAVTLWLVANVRRLRAYAREAQVGQRQPPPDMPGELGELALAMDAMRERLDGRERLEQTVRALTHELKSPLAALRASGELLQDELAPADRERFAAQVVEQSERLRALIDRMLELSKLELLQAPAHRDAVDLAALVDAQLRAAAGRLEQRGLDVRWLTRADARIAGDAELLGLAVSNVLTNAIDFAPRGSLLELSVTAAEGQVLLSVRDHGPGVPPAAWDQLGQRFFSTARPGSLIKGSGLGLAIVRQIALLHGGTLAFERAEPGLRVVLRLPGG